VGFDRNRQQPAANGLAELLAVQDPRSSTVEKSPARPPMNREIPPTERRTAWGAFPGFQGAGPSRLGARREVVRPTPADGVVTTNAGVAPVSLGRGGPRKLAAGSPWPPLSRLLPRLPPSEGCLAALVGQFEFGSAFDPQRQDLGSAPRSSQETRGEPRGPKASEGIPLFRDTTLASCGKSPGSDPVGRRTCWWLPRRMRRRWSRV
jgi:hypothetical protein